MQPNQKQISYKTTNSYSTLNTLTKNTQYVWFVCHGMGYLSRYFLKYFKDLPKDEHYIIAPQAPSKYYIQPEFKHVGASWLTKENTVADTQNILTYFDAILAAEAIPKHCKLIVLGYSQGVSVALRYISSRTLQCLKLVIMSGGIPKELTVDDFKFLNASVTITYGTSDEYLNNERILYEISRAKDLFGKHLNIIPFNGNHKVNTTLINTLTTT